MLKSALLTMAKGERQDMSGEGVSNTGVNSRNLRWVNLKIARSVSQDLASTLRDMDISDPGAVEVKA